MTAAVEFDPRDYDAFLDIRDAIVEMVGERVACASVGVVCGSGLGKLAALLGNAVEVPFAKIPGFRVPNVEGHKGNFVFGELHGVRVVCQQGRFHPYSHGMDLALCATPVRIMHLLGIHTLIVSNAVGGIDEHFKLGNLMVIKDHIFLPGLAGFSPFIGLRDARFGAQFVSVHNCYDKSLRDEAKQVLTQIDVEKDGQSGQGPHEGVYAMTGGPQYETPAEVRALRALGASVLGMSTCHEVVVARQLNVRVLGFSLITNIANVDADAARRVSHADVLKAAAEGSERANRFVSEMIRRIVERPPHKPMTPVLRRERARQLIVTEEQMAIAHQSPHACRIKSPFSTPQKDR